MKIERGESEMIAIDISIYAIERLEQMLADDGRDDIGVRVRCVPG